MTTGEPGELKLHMMESTYRNLNRLRIQNVMLLCSLYDYYTVEEDGMLEDILQGASFAGETGGAPSFHQVPDAPTALRMLRDPAGVRFDLIICMSTGDGSTFREFQERVREINGTIPVTVLTHNTEELRKVSSRNPGSVPYRLFTWMGNGEIIGGIIQLAENTLNAPGDCGELGAPCLLLVEDDVTFYSRYLHQGMEVVHRSCRDSLSSMKSSTRQKLKARARTKILLATNMEEALENLEAYSHSLVGVVTDMRFHRNGTHDKKAGLTLIETVREKAPGERV